MTAVASTVRTRVLELVGRDDADRALADLGDAVGLRAVLELGTDQ